MRKSNYFLFSFLLSSSLFFFLPSFQAQPCDTLLYSDGINFFPDPVDSSGFSVAAIDNDSNAVNPALTPYGITSDWQVYSEVVLPGDTNYYLGATSYFATPDSADNWLMFGGTTIPATGAVLQWQHRFLDNGFRDGYQVMINTVGNTISDFINNGTVLLTIADNDPSTNGDTVWATRSVNIDSSIFVGQKVYIAFHHNAYDMFLLFLDNFLIKDCSLPCPEISMMATLSNPTTCSSSDGSIDVIPSGGFTPYSYLWSNGNTLNQISNLSAQAYSVTVTDFNGCTTDSSFTLTSPSGLSVSVTSTDETAPGANDGTATATASGGTSPYSYNWSNGSFTAGIANLVPGTYTVTVTDAGGCTTTGSVTVNPFNCTLTVTATSTNETAPNANDGTATAVGTGGTTPYSFNWNDGQVSSIATGLAPATYFVTVTDAIGCTATDSVVVDSFICAFSAIATATGETSIGASDGTASVTTSGGISPYIYLWSNNGTTSIISGLSAGTYNVTVTDGNNCTATASATVDPASLCNIVITNVSITNPSCSGSGDGQISITNSGGTGTLTFTWSNGNSGNTAYNLAAGTYSLTISDMNNCVADTTVSISQPAPLSGTMSHTNETCAGCSDGTASVTVSGGTPPFSYNWTNGQTSPVITGLPAGIYSVFVQDANGCLIQGSDTVQPAVLETEEFQFMENNFKIFPNPNAGKFQVSVIPASGKEQSGNHYSVYKITVYNILGEEIYLGRNTTDANPVTIDLIYIPKGIYLVKVEIPEGSLLKKIIIE